MSDVKKFYHEAPRTFLFFVVLLFCFWLLCMCKHVLYNAQSDYEPDDSDDHASDDASEKYQSEAISTHTYI